MKGEKSGVDLMFCCFLLPLYYLLWSAEGKSIEGGGGGKGKEKKRSALPWTSHV